MTFNAAHQYLGLTSEVLRTEKAINDIACHPLPPSFYEGGGLRQLRQRFDGVSSPDPSDVSSDYFSVSSSKRSSKTSLATADPEERKRSTLTDSPTTIYRSPATLVQATSSRQNVQAGDLLSSTSHPSEVFRPAHQSRNSLFTPSLSRRRLPSEAVSAGPSAISNDDFDLRDAVMSCIAKSIGLLQPPLSGDESIEASPLFSPSESSRSRNGMFRPSFGSLSLLEIGDDESSSMTGSTASTTADGYMSGLDNDVEILFYPAGSTLAKAGESNTGEVVSFANILQHDVLMGLGLFYVIEGFLDILLPPDVDDSPNTGSSSGRPRTPGHQPTPHPSISDRYPSNAKFAYPTHSKSRSHKPLFTVKPGGIAGYLCRFTFAERLHDTD